MHDTPRHLSGLIRKQQDVVPYFGLGYRKTRLPAEVHEKLLAHLHRHVRDFTFEGEIEHIETADPTCVPTLFFSDASFNRELSRALQPLHEEWSGMTLVPTSCYGIRVYQRGCYLYPHLDRISTHVISSTICIDHRLRRPWPLWIEDAQGVAHEVAMDPGDLVFYESARLRHGRPYPLEGEYYAAAFVHYKPIDWNLSLADLQ